MIQVSLVGYACGGAFLGLAYWDMPYHLVALIVVLGKLVENYKEMPQQEENVLLGNNAMKKPKKKWAWEQ